MRRGRRWWHAGKRGDERKGKKKIGETGADSTKRNQDEMFDISFRGGKA